MNLIFNKQEREAMAPSIAAENEARRQAVMSYEEFCNEFAQCTNVRPLTEAEEERQAWLAEREFEKNDPAGYERFLLEYSRDVNAEAEARAEARERASEVSYETE
jgi:hypothetical protein